MEPIHGYASLVQQKHKNLTAGIEAELKGKQFRIGHARAKCNDRGEEMDLPKAQKVNEIVNTLNRESNLDAEMCVCEIFFVIVGKTIIITLY